MTTATPTRIQEVPRNDPGAAIAFFGYAVEHGLRLDDIADMLARLQDTPEQSLALMAEIERRWPSTD